MNLSLLTRHPTLFSLVCGSLSLSISLSVGLGTMKSSGDISWLDILGESSLVILPLAWIFFLLISRPPGKVTSALVIGLSFFLFSACLDLFDEWMFYQHSARYLSMVESIPAALGMVIMSYALLQWHQEQLVLNQQLHRRESENRQHDQVDFITKLYGAEYMREKIQRQLTLSWTSAFSIVMLDIDNFDHFNRRFGHQEGDRLLREISELILMNLRSTDLACRYAGDRFILLLPDTNQDTATELAEQVRQAVSHLAYKPQHHKQAVFHNLSYVTESITSPEQEADGILNRVTQRLDLSKQTT